MTPSATSPTNSKARDLEPAVRPPAAPASARGASAVDDSFDDDAVEDRKREDRQDGAEVKAAEHWHDAAEQAQVRFADLAQERQQGVERARVGRPQPDGEQQLHDD